MIYTVTLNPSLDYYMDFKDIVIGNLNRSVGESYVFGGKGINVSKMLKLLDIKSCAIAAVGGFTGDILVKELLKDEIDIKPVYVNGNTRINVKLSKTNTELNGAGGCCGEESVNELRKLLNSAKNGDIVVFAGSILNGFDKAIYGELTKELSDKGVLCVVDADDDALKFAVKGKPFLIKPSNIELGRLFNVKIDDVKSAVYYAAKLVDDGVKNVLVSMGDKGAVFLNGSEQIYEPALKTELDIVSTVGAGDCMLAGFLCAYTNQMPFSDCVKFAVAVGSARVVCNGFPSLAQINKILKR